MSLLDHYRNILAGYKTAVIDDVKEKLFGEEQSQNNTSNNKFNPLKELYFNSHNNKDLPRYYQTLYYSKTAYGMECNPSVVMYFLQSYGLIPKNITRKAFEHIFTPLNPPHGVEDSGENSLPKSGEEMQVGNGEVFRPKNDLFDNLFSQGAESFLRGFTGAIFPHIEGSDTTLLAICKRFYDLSFEEGYTSLQKYRNKDGYKELAELGIKNKYEDLKNGITNANYFKKHIIFVGLAHYPPLPGHYCLIVGTPTTDTIDGVDFWVYKADDPYYGQTFVYVPKSAISDIGSFASAIKTKRKQNRLIYPNCAIGV